MIESPFLNPQPTKISFLKKIEHMFKRVDLHRTEKIGAPTEAACTAFSWGVYERVASRLPREFWPDSALADLRSVFSNWSEVTTGVFSHLRNSCKNQVLQIVASANIPITWVHPAAAAAWLGYSRVHINLPTLRADDPASAAVIGQIKSLVSALNPEFASLEICLHERRIAHPDELGADLLVVFGSDVTCRVFEESSQKFKAKLLTFGDVWNCADVSSQKHSTNEIAAWCAAWQGRGCLTPVVLFVREGKLAHREFVLALSNQLDAILSNGAQAFRDSQRYLHRHDLIEIAAVLKNHGVSPERAIIRGKFSWIVDCVSMETRLIDVSNLPLRAGGSGLVFLLPAHQKENAELKWLGVHSCQPQISDQHMGKTWFEWLSVNFN